MDKKGTPEFSTYPEPGSLLTQLPTCATQASNSASLSFPTGIIANIQAYIRETAPPEATPLFSADE
jgi:hypothetical protein